MKPSPAGPLFMNGPAVHLRINPPAASGVPVQPEGEVARSGGRHGHQGNVAHNSAEMADRGGEDKDVPDRVLER